MVRCFFRKSEEQGWALKWHLYRWDEWLSQTGVLGSSDVERSAQMLGNLQYMFVFRLLFTFSWQTQTNGHHPGEPVNRLASSLAATMKALRLCAHKHSHSPPTPTLWSDWGVEAKPRGLKAESSLKALFLFQDLWRVVIWALFVHKRCCGRTLICLML